MYTLYGYILRELLKSFGLTVIGLSALFTMGGMLFTVMRYEGVTTNDLVRVAPMLLPIILTLTMPVSALFATTMVYGRLAADNELVACRAAGVNVHRLFLPPIALSLVVALFSLFSINLVIPQFMQQIINYGRTNLRDIAFARIRQRGYIHFNKKDGQRYILTARAVQDVTEGALIEKGFPPPDHYMRYFWIEEPTFLWIDADERLKRFAVAKGGLCQFDTRGDDVKLTVVVRDAFDYDVARPGSAYVEQQEIGPIVVPRRFPLKPAMVDLKTLLLWREQPWESPDLRETIDQFVVRAEIYGLYRQLADQVDRGETLAFSDESGRRYELSAASVETGERGPRLIDALLVRHEPGQARPTRIRAPLADLSIAPDVGGDLIAEVGLKSDEEQPVLEYNPRTGDDSVPLRVDSFSAANLAIPEEQFARARRYDPADLATDRPDVVLEIDESMAPELAEIRNDADRLRRKVAGLVHFRLGFAGSPLVTVLMGAVLGVIFRGSRALAAFGLACVPFGLAALLILVGRQLIDGESAEWIGATVIWGGLASIAVADVVLMRLGVSR